MPPGSVVMEGNDLLRFDQSPKRRLRKDTTLLFYGAWLAISGEPHFMADAVIDAMDCDTYTLRGLPPLSVRLRSSSRISRRRSLPTLLLGNISRNSTY